MGDDIEIRKRLDACPYAYLVGFAEGDDSFSLKLEVIEARAEHHQPRGTEAIQNDTTADDYEVVRSTVLAGSVPIRSSPGCALFTITFEGYIMFAVRDETYAIPEKDEDFTKKLRTYKTSALLDYVEKSSWVSEDLVGPIKHLAIVCLDRIVDVICTKDPVMSIRITNESEYN